MKMNAFYLFVLHAITFCITVSAGKFKSIVRDPNSDRFFQGFDHQSCYWSNYVQYHDWNLYSSTGDPDECASACLKTNGCTGFELLYEGNKPYCAFWFGGACSHEEMELPPSNVATYVLMDGVARFRNRRCSNNSAATLIQGASATAWGSLTCEFSCIAINYNNKKGTTSLDCAAFEAPTRDVTSFRPISLGDHCKLFLDPMDTTCTLNDLVVEAGTTAGLLYELGDADPPFEDAFSMCNPYSEVMRGYKTCEAYVDAFPCDCNKKLSQVCTNKNVSNGGGYFWTKLISQTAKTKQCFEKKILSNTTLNPDDIAGCKSLCVDKSDCECISFQSNGLCFLHGDPEPNFSDALQLRVRKSDEAYSESLIGGDFCNGECETLSLTRALHTSETLSSICPSQCQAQQDATCQYHSGLSFIFMLTIAITPIALVIIFGLAIFRHIRRVFCRDRNGLDADTEESTPAMKKEEIEEMAVEEFSGESQLKYGEIECSICITAFELGDKMRVMKCGHRFHKECVDEWLSQYKAVCPLCKNDMRCTEVNIEMSEMQNENSTQNIETESTTASQEELQSDGNHEIGELAVESRTEILEDEDISDNVNLSAPLLSNTNTTVPSLHPDSDTAEASDHNTVEL